MNDRPTPETDEAASEIIGITHQGTRIMSWKGHAQKLERERDESKRALKTLLDAHDQFGSGASLNHPRLTMAISAARKTLSPK